MANIVLNNDLSNGHGGFPATKAQASSSVTINGIAIVLEGDPYEAHSDATSTHTPVAIGNSSITINGTKIVLSGASLGVGCGDTATASSSVSVTPVT